MCALYGCMHSVVIIWHKTKPFIQKTQQILATHEFPTAQDTIHCLLATHLNLYDDVDDVIVMRCACNRYPASINLLYHHIEELNLTRNHICYINWQ